MLKTSKQQSSWTTAPGFPGGNLLAKRGHKKSMWRTDRNPRKTIIPVARLGLGFGGGCGEKNGKNKPAGTPGGESGNLGGGLSAKPIGIIEVTPAPTHFIRFHTWRYIALGMAIGRAISRFSRRTPASTALPELITRNTGQIKRAAGYQSFYLKKGDHHESHSTATA
jgi:hypothetical protein